MGIVYERADLAGTGLDPEVVGDLCARADALAAELGELGYMKALDAAPPAPPRTGADRVVVLGIGGSALGARAVHQACPGPGLRPMVVVDNIDPDALEAAWAGADPARTTWVVVSKSGQTTETLTQCAVVRERLLPLDAWKDVHVVTGASGPLREMAAADGLPVYGIPEEVGGRFSVFTPAATVPLALAGHDTGALLEGGRGARDHCSAGGGIAAQLAALLVAAAGAGRNVVTLWSYAERLETLGEWFRQLWAESLGKPRADGTPVGQSPIGCVGSTDQHSIQQLMVEGPPDKVVLVLAGPPTSETATPEGQPLWTILRAMRRATTAGMVRAGCPAATIHLEEWSERTMGLLLMSFLAATSIAGELLGVDPFGQPGVEAAKLATRALLEEPGGEADREIGRLLGEGGGTRCP